MLTVAWTLLCWMLAVASPIVCWMLTVAWPLVLLFYLSSSSPVGHKATTTFLHRVLSLAAAWASPLVCGMLTVAWPLVCGMLTGLTPVVLNVRLDSRCAQCQLWPLMCWIIALNANVVWPPWVECKLWLDPIAVGPGRLKFVHHQRSRPSAQTSTGKQRVAAAALVVDAPSNCKWPCRLFTLGVIYLFIFTQSMVKWCSSYALLLLFIYLGVDASMF